MLEVKILIEPIGLILVGLSSVYLLPQIIKVYKTKKVNDLSYFFLCYNFGVHLLWTLYNTYRIINDSSILPYLINSLLRTITALILLLLFLGYSHKTNFKNQ